ncbi:uncharacterized protein palmda isoform X2 [Archocentrus centrarchus]|uniref:uncharacterized protein palmda isoform X2 n=1 Tax=Archocentrus centrarchus TaxID=63155 RepID=UPI0011EA0EB6|nr:uncharacterized protein LOC115796130 isoform X2 [Archocentrus centrarchus]
MQSTAHSSRAFCPTSNRPERCSSGSTEMEVESLEREESMISTNEGFILNRLKTVEKSPEEIIKEAHSSFVPEPLQVTTVIPDVPEFLSSPASERSEPNTPRKILDVPLEELHQHTTLKGSHDQLSDNEVEHLLRSATVHHQVKYQNCCQHSRTREEQSFSSHRDERDRNQAGHCDKHVLRRHIAEKDFSCSENWQRKPHSEHRYSSQESCYIRNEGRNKQTILKESRYKALDHLCRNQQDCHYSSYQLRNCHSIQEGGPACHHLSSITRSSSRMNGSRSNGYHPLSSHDQEVLTAYQPQFSYTPSYIPPTDYISEEHYCYCLPSYKPNRQTENSHNRDTAQYRDPTYPHSVPSPLYRDDPPYTILNTLDTTEPITAIFMGFQTARDDSRQVQGFEGSLKAELVIVEDNEDFKDSNMKDKRSHGHIRTGSTSSGTMQGVGDRHTERRVGPGIRKIQKNQQSCCSLC